ncbi:uncharacterized protein LOC132204680 [Neocloeon triangulifer]|uniref:uncharacterized protein LOC132204680 n=1 Tax=Neocloeon triangulifer TaxID=2078957 RepID=UPI00286FA8AA|nr:uncharacterized protein LOC132204680 [Neocloeon triangulifer]
MLTTKFIVLVALLILAFSPGECKRSLKSKKSKSSKIAYRQTIVNCCGRNTCFNSNGLSKISATKSTQSKPNLVTNSTLTPGDDEQTSLDMSEAVTEINGNTVEESSTGQETLADNENSVTSTINQEISESTTTANKVSSPDLSTSVISPTSSTTTSTTTMSPTTATIPPGALYSCSSTLCQKNNSLIKPDNSVSDAPSYGYWKEACGILYLFGKSIVTWEANRKKCCSLGMVPITIENADKQTCLNKLVETWEYNTNYWTSARRIWPNDTFQFCSPGAISLPTTGSIWAPSHPASNGSCVHLFINQTHNVTQLTTKNCSDSFIFACQGPPTPAPPCHAPKCLPTECKKDDSLFRTLEDNQTSVLANPSTHGTWFTFNERTYLFSIAKKSWSDASKECCRIGMKLLSVDNDYEYNNLQMAIRSNNSIMAGNYWTSASDEGCEKSFGWCAVNKLVRDAIWATGQPDNAGGKENCLVVGVDKNKAELQDEDCLKTFQYICEARDTTNSSTAGNAIKNECMAVFNVSEDEVDNIFNSTKFDTRIKCFLKCVGENGGYIVNGKLVDEGIIKMAEEISGNSSQDLQDNLMAIDSCENIKGMDECDTAALVYQCGQEKAPDLVASAIATAEQNSSAEEVPLPPQRAKCPTGFQCAVNPVLRRFYNQDIPLPGTVSFQTGCLGSRMAFFTTPTTYNAAETKCCKLGMRLVTIGSKEKFDCIVDLNYLATAPRPIRMWTSGSSLGKTGEPVWCVRRKPVNVTEFQWNNGAGISKIANKYLIVMHTEITTAASYLMNVPGTADELYYPMCQEY